MDYFAVVARIFPNTCESKS